MHYQAWIAILQLFFAGIVGWSIHSPLALSLTPELSQKIGLQIWLNECGGKVEGLTTWNDREEFASLGIGHFIWYPPHEARLFNETFPDLLKLFRLNQVKLPDWLETAQGCPWHSRQDFQSAQQMNELQELRDFLAKHVDLQILYMTQRLQQALPLLLQFTSPDQRAHVTFQFYRLAHTPAGLYALLDYLNFKGEGTSPREAYQGVKWGLLQVLEGLQGTEVGQAANAEFVKVAKEVLSRRVDNSPANRQETRWLKGWFNRLDTYQKFNSI
jgi:hypothetical protein